MSAEILTVLFAYEQQAAFQHTNINSLAKVIVHRLQKEQEGLVMEAICKLCEALFVTKNSAFLSKFIQAEGWLEFIKWYITNKLLTK